MSVNEILDPDIHFRIKCFICSVHTAWNLFVGKSEVLQGCKPTNHTHTYIYIYMNLNIYVKGMVNYYVLFPSKSSYTVIQIYIPCY
jgi:hypothetical protein